MNNNNPSLTCYLCSFPFIVLTGVCGMIEHTATIQPSMSLLMAGIACGCLLCSSVAAIVTGSPKSQQQP